MKIHTFTFNPLQENTYLIWDETTLEAAVIDPGMSEKTEKTLFSVFLKKNNLKLVLCLQTHCHFDHILGVEYIYKTYGIQTRFSMRELNVYQAMPSWANMYNIKLNEPLPPQGAYLCEGEVLRLGETDIQVISTCGHTPGGVSFYVPSQQIVFTGDTLFKGSMGRTDLGGNMRDLQRSILHNLLTLPANTRVYPGHGPTTTISDERINWGI